MNNKTIFSWFSFIFLILAGLPTQAQVIRDGSTNTTVTPSNSGVSIEGGERAGSNLFHSFQEFSVPVGTEAFFNNANDIVNIFSRVTGGKLSNIEGLIRANGAANLFLINPAGIVFGENARLDIGGSFYGSSAESILFPEGIEFSANSQQAPVLTVNAPIGLRFRDNPGAIINRSRFQNTTKDELVGLEVRAGKTLALVGGDINFESGVVTAKGGTVTIGALAGAAEVSIAENGSLSLPQEVARADVNLKNGAEINVQATGGGNVNIDARQLNLEAGELGRSEIKAGVISGSNTTLVQAGNITINAAESISINQSSIKNRVEEGAIGNAGNININANTIEFDDANLTTEVDDGGQGNGGDITITSQRLSAKNETNIETDVEDESLGGEAGSVLITANTIEFDNSQIDTELETGIGRGGDVSLEANNIVLKNEASINAKTEGQGNAGDINITANTIELDEANITAEVGDEGLGNGGTVTIKSQRFVAKNGTSIEGDIEDESLGGNGGNILITANTIEIDNSDIDTEVEIGAMGKAGDVSLRANDIVLKNNAAIESTLEGEGRAGDIDITANNLEIDNSSIDTKVETGATGIAGKVRIEANNIIFKNGAAIISKTSGQGDGGDININARTIELNNSIITSEVDDEATGSGGNVNLTIADTIKLRNNSLISAQAIEDANGGNININAGLIIAFPSNGNGNDIIANAQRGQGGNITIITEALLGLSEGIAVPENDKNDIDASSEFGLDGNVTFIISDASVLRETTELASNVIEDTVALDNACSTSSEPSRLVVQGKGGIPSLPNAVLNTEILLSNDKPVGLNLPQSNNLQQTSNLTAGVQSVKTSVGDIYPARGVIVEEDGKVILTAYPINQSHPRIPDNFGRCGSISDTNT
ncbi:MAG: filamentous hemagglutinin N-terminal domain-containing protein [Xenococcaceae cyanobacterium MO_167.B52]|nr:filamentous hemagglutinin N-terminal domain-containing protein [Xenococcaceae cyanobacterium MO_167.B52]